MFKRLSLLSFAFLLFFNASVVLAFSDTNNEAVNFLRAHNIFDKALNFYPDKKATRGEFVMWALRNREVFFEENTRILEPFVDVDTEREAPYIATAWRLGAIPTKPNFYPSYSLTRLDALKILFAIEGIPTPRAGFAVSSYKDLPKTADDRGVISKALEMRIINPLSDEKFGTYAFMTRLEVAELLYKAYLISAADQGIFQVGEELSGRPKEDIFDYVWSSIHSRSLYLDDLQDEDLMEGAIGGMVDAIGDPYTVYFPKQATQDFLDPLEGQMEGIGAQVDADPLTGYIYIVLPLRDSPAEKAGLKSGDIVLKADGKELKGLTVSEAISLIKGKEGTTVTLSILRDGIVFDVKIVRAKINLSSVYGEVRDGFLIIQITFFASDTVREFDEFITKNYNNTTKGIIIDLRGDPGGFLDTATELISYFFADERLALSVKRANAVDPLWVQGNGKLTKAPLAILVNEYSASASEIFAGAMQDHKRGIIIGNTTFGKGTVQELIQFYDGSSLKITIAGWLLPSGRSIDKIGITPDIVLTDTTSDAIINRAMTELYAGKGRPTN